MHFEIYYFLKFVNIVYFITQSTISKHLGVTTPTFFLFINDQSVSVLMTEMFIEQPLALSVSANKPLGKYYGCLCSALKGSVIWFGGILWCGE